MIDEKELELLSLAAKELLDSFNEKRYVMTEVDNVYYSVDTLNKEELVKKIKEQDKVISVSKKKLKRIKKKLENSDSLLNLGELTLSVSGLLPYLGLFQVDSINAGIAVSMFGMATVFLLSVPAVLALFNKRVNEKILNKMKMMLLNHAKKRENDTMVAADNKERLLRLLEYANYLEFLKDVKNANDLKRFSDSFTVLKSNDKEKIISRIS